MATADRLKPRVYIDLSYEFEGSEKETPFSLSLFVADGREIVPELIVHIPLSEKGPSSIRSGSGPAQSALRIGEVSVEFPPHGNFPTDTKIHISCNSRIVTEDNLVAYRHTGTTLVALPIRGRATPPPGKGGTRHIMRTAMGNGKTVEKGILIVHSIRFNAMAASISFVAPPETDASYWVDHHNAPRIVEYLSALGSACWERTKSKAANPLHGGDAPSFIYRNQFPSYPRHTGLDVGRSAEMPMAMYLHAPGPCKMGNGCARSLLSLALWRHGISEDWWVSAARKCLGEERERDLPGKESVCCMAILAEAAAAIPSSLPYVEDQVDSNRSRHTWSEGMVEHCEVVGKMLCTMGNDCEDAAAAAVDAWMRFGELGESSFLSETEVLMGRLSRLFVPVSVLGIATAAKASDRTVPGSRFEDREFRMGSREDSRARVKSMRQDSVFGHKWAAFIPLPYMRTILRKATGRAEASLYNLADEPRWLRRMPPLIGEGTCPTWPLILDPTKWWSNCVVGCADSPLHSRSSTNDTIRRLGAISFLSGTCSSYGTSSISTSGDSDFYILFTILDLPPHEMFNSGEEVICQLVLGTGRDRSGKLFMGVRTCNFVDHEAMAESVEVDVGCSFTHTEYARISRLMRFFEKPCSPIYSHLSSVIGTGTMLPWGERVLDSQTLALSAAKAITGFMGGSLPPSRGGCGVGPSFYAPLSSFYPGAEYSERNLRVLEDVCRRASDLGLRVDFSSKEVFSGYFVARFSILRVSE